jgi:hypothetical protein
MSAREKEAPIPLAVRCQPAATPKKKLPGTYDDPGELQDYATPALARPPRDISD